MYSQRIASLSVYDGRLGEAVWVLWVQQDGEGDGPQRHFAGRVKLQDDPVATAEAVLDEAINQVQAALIRWDASPLF